MFAARWLLALTLIAGCTGSSSAARGRTFVAVGELDTEFTAGSTGFDFVFFPDSGQAIVGMHLVDRDSARELYRLTDARPDQRLRVELAGTIEQVSVSATHEEPASTMPSIRVSSYEVLRGKE